ncbi:MAG: hypothetical protein E3J60_03450 [Dehalococcoidia bacterium]|nr:MAG: hypothetical protein E3J60_03450 [Dehalococcoidia bacterium]
MLSSNKESITQAFADIQWGLGPTEGVGFYKSRKGSVAEQGPAPSLSFPGAALENNEDGPFQTKSEAEGLGLGDYKDLIAKSATPEKPISPCGAWALISECESGDHHFGKRIYCGREWCEVCGEDNSASHKRRQARILPKIQQVKELGYLVIEWPDWARHIGERGLNPDQDQGDPVAGWCYSKADLQETTNMIIEVLAGRRCGRRGRVGGFFARGVGRWHWFGDQCQGKWNPHFNVLVESGYLSKPELEGIKASLRFALNCPELIVHYSYFDKPGQMVQKVRYITRATFRDYSWNPYMAQDLFNFRNIRWWGNWKGEPAWDLGQAKVEGEDIAGLEAVSKLQEGLCPDCGQPLKVLYHNHRTGQPVQWSRPVDSIYLDIWGAQEISGTGYYRIPRQGWHGYIFSPGELLKLEKLAVKARASPSVSPEARMAREHVNAYWERKRRAWDELEDMGFGYFLRNAGK